MTASPNRRGGVITKIALGIVVLWSFGTAWLMAMHAPFCSRAAMASKEGRLSGRPFCIEEHGPIRYYLRVAFQQFSKWNCNCLTGRGSHVPTLQVTD